MFGEARFAYFKAREEGAGLGPDSWLRALANNQRMASQAFGVELGECRVGAAADFIVLDYRPPTPMSPDNLAGHLAFGFESGSVESVMVNGRFIVKDRRMPFDEQEVYEQMQRATRRLWSAL